MELLEYKTIAVECTDCARALGKAEIYCHNWRLILKYKAQNRIPKGKFMKQVCKRQFKNNKSGKLSQIPWNVMEQHI